MSDSILSALANNPALMEAVKAELLKQFSLDTITDQAPNELLGQMVRARLEGKAKIEAAFREIAKYKKGVDNSLTINPAR